MNDAIKYVNIRADWFEEHEKSGSKMSIIGFDSLNLYLHLFKFYVPKQEAKYIFYTCLSALRKVTGYTTEEVVSKLKLLKSQKIIKMSNLSRWDYLMTDTGKYDDNRFLIIEAIDVPNIKPDKESNSDYWVTVDIEYLHNHYKNLGMNDRFYPLYCLIRKLSSGHSERKSYMTIENMAKLIGYDKDTVNRMISKMNKQKVLFSKKCPNGKKGYRLDHYLCFGDKYLKEFEAAYYPPKGQKKKK